MVKEHPIFKQPESENITLWRYLDFTKFLSLIDSGQLFLSRLDEFDDPFEGSFPKKNIQVRNDITFDLKGKALKNYVDMIQDTPRINELARKHVTVNCWHANEYESAAMWRLYLKSGEGIALRTTYKNLKESIIDDEPVYAGMISYIDYELDEIEYGNFFAPYVYKRKSFEHEKEVRLLACRFPIVNVSYIDFSQEPIHPGISLNVDLNKMIDKVYVSPEAPKWFAELTKNVISKYGYSFEVVQSDLNSSPLY